MRKRRYEEKRRARSDAPGPGWSCRKYSPGGRVQAISTPYRLWRLTSRVNKNRMSPNHFFQFRARLREYLRECSVVDRMGKSAAVTDHKFDELALELFRLQYAENLVYQRFCEVRGVSLEDVRHWSQIPAIPTVAFKELELTVVPIGERVRVFHSSGTTQHRPSRHFHSRESLAIYREAIRPWFTRHLLPESESNRVRIRGVGRMCPRVLAVLTPPRVAAPHSSLVYMFETVRRSCEWESVAFCGRIGQDGGWDLDGPAAWTFLKQATDNGLAVLLLGTAFSFVHLLDFLESHGESLALPAGSRVLETGGYKGRSRVLPKAELHGRIENRLGIPQTHIVCEYGMSELSSQAYDRVCGSPAESHYPGAKGTNEIPGAQGIPPSPPTEEGVGERTPWNRSEADRRTSRSLLAEHTEPGLMLQGLLSPNPSPPKEERGTDPALPDQASSPEGGARGGGGEFSRRFRFPPWARAQVISPETNSEARDGQTGLIRVYDLANVSSVMAIQTEDLAVRHGDGFELLGRRERAEPRGCSLMAV
jgi:hypothetical protein